jgi:hypothetical protein
MTKMTQQEKIETLQLLIGIVYGLIWGLLIGYAMGVFS